MALPPGRARLSTKPAPTGSTTSARTRPAWCESPATTAPGRAATARITSGASATNSAAYLANVVGIAGGPASIDPHIAAGGPAQFLQALQERREAGLCFRIVCGVAISTPTRRIRSPCCARAASGHAAAPPSSVMNCAPLHSITSSARASRVGGTSRPSALAVLRLMTSSNLVGCWTGRSPGEVPLRMRSM